ncbi:MAG: protein-L-isoaspartate(D-aspartate) O-methyltransferase [Candidatus Sericytochromatia bacterium]
MEEWQTYHHRLLEHLRRQPELHDIRVLKAVASVPRHVFIPDQPLDQAYADKALPTAQNQTISQPSLVAWMTELLELKGHERVLEIGTGSGYQTALLSRLVKEVYSIERIASLSQRAAAILQKLHCHNVHLRVGDGYLGWPEAAPFDCVILTAAPPEMPPALEQQIREGGILVAPIGGQNDIQHLLKGVKRGQDVYANVVSEVRFVPMVPD